MAQIVQPWTRLRDPRFSGDELPFPDFGLTCQACGRSLVGAVRLVCPHCAQSFDPQALRPPKKWFSVDPETHEPLPVPTIELILRAEQVPCVVHETHTALGIAGWRLLVPSEFYFEVLWLSQQARQQLGSGAHVEADDDWQCRHCQEQNPAGFDVCWNCQSIQ